MIKLLSVITVASTLFQLSLPITALAQMSEPLCYITTSSGTILNLTSMCEGGRFSQFSQLQSTVQSNLYLQGVTAKLKKNGSEFERVISGDVVNDSLNTHLLAKLEYQTYKMSSGRLIKDESGSESLATGYGIRPGESVTFDFKIPKNFGVIVLKVKSDKFSGNPVCFASSQEKEDYCKQLTKEIRRF